MLPFKRYQSPNYNERGDVALRYLVLHYTGMKRAKAALQRLCDPEAEVSAHYVVEENGRVHHLVPDDKRAWHAGLSHWRGETDINAASIGIEIVNPGHEFGYRAFPERQIRSLIRLCEDVMAEHMIAPAAVLGHSDVAPTRKQDPGELFPWQRLAAHDIGLWPAPTDADYQSAAAMIDQPARLHELLIALGYDPSVPFETLLEAFHRRYYPEKFASNSGQDPDALSAAKIITLLRAFHEH